MEKKYFLIMLMLCLLTQWMSVFAESCTNNLQLNVAPDMGRAPLIQAIYQAHQSVELGMYLFTDKKIAAALTDAAARGVQVHVLLEHAPYTFEQANQWLVHYWQGSKVLWHWAPAKMSALNFLHEKLLIIDHHQAWIMTLNFTHSSFSKKKRERNFILWDSNAIDVQKLEAIFAKDWSEQAVDEVSLGPATAIVLSPFNTQRQLTHLLKQAHQQIKIYADGLDDYAFIDTLIAAAKKGISIKIIASEPLHESVTHDLTAAGVELRATHCFVNHAKAIVVDNQSFYVGSANFTHNAFTHNRELGLIAHDTCIAQQLSNQFDRDWGCE